MKLPLPNPLALVSALFVLTFLPACEKKPTVAESPNPESAKTFDATTNYLDAGGDIYLYLRTEQILEKVPGFLDRWKKALVEMSGDDAPLPPDQIDAWYAAGRDAITNSGLTELRAFGFSAIQLKPDLSRTKSVVYLGEDQNPGMLWQLGGSREPHPFEALDFLPATTIYAAFCDFNPTAFYSYLLGVIESLPNAAIRAQAQQYPAIAEMVLGMPPAEFVASLGDEIGFVITADESATMTIPADPPFELPKGSAAVLFRVADDKLYDLLVTKIDATVAKMYPPTKSDADGVKMVTVPIPDTGLPLSPTVARFGNYTAIATSAELVTQLARTAADPPALFKDTDAFKAFEKLEKMEGNGFGYFSERGSQILRDFQMRSFTKETDVPPAVKMNLEKFYELFSQKYIFTISRHEKGALTSITYSPRGSEQLVATALVVPAAVVAAVALPAIAEAKAKAEILSEPPTETRALDAVEPDAADEPAPTDAQSTE